ncbi:MAG: hypothetical protein ACRD2A_16195 [Vicinamibacterales bacterium]
MKKLTFLAAALVALGSVAANAQDTTKKEAKGDVVKMPTVATLITAIDGSAATVAKLGTFKPTPEKIQVVDVATLITAPTDDAALKAAIEKNKDGIEQVRAELKKHDVVTTALSNSPQKPDPGDIVAAEVQEDRLIVFIWKK